MHTPGPWNWHGPYMAGGFKVTALDHNDVTMMDIYVKAETAAEAQANARLIAAAPDLLEALRKIASCESRFPGDVVDIARAAIAKATGEQP